MKGKNIPTSILGHSKTGIPKKKPLATKYTATKKNIPTQAQTR
jgi:hypothetical protein